MKSINKKTEEILINFEKALEAYKLLLSEKLNLFEESPKNKARIISGDFYKTGQVISYEMSKCITKELCYEFNQELFLIHDYADNPFIHTHQRRNSVKKIEQIYWGIKPLLEEFFIKQNKKEISLNLLDNVDDITKEYLFEAVNAYNANAVKASVVMAGAALESILRNIHEKKFGESSKKNLGEIMNDLDKTKNFSESEKIILRVSKLFRNFCAHPSQMEVDNELAKTIIKSVESFVNQNAIINSQK